MRLDRVSIFQNQLSFLIPHEWIEGPVEADHYLYHSPNTDSGWFRVSLISLKDRPISRGEFRKLLSKTADERSGTFNERNMNIVVFWQQMSEESGVDICNYWWCVGHWSDVQLSYKAMFSYTILREEVEEPENKSLVPILTELVSEATFKAS